jgi:hypothetical protein
MQRVRIQPLISWMVLGLYVGLSLSGYKLCYGADGHTSIELAGQVCSTDVASGGAGDRACASMASQSLPCVDVPLLAKTEAPNTTRLSVDRLVPAWPVLAAHAGDAFGDARPRQIQLPSTSEPPLHWGAHLRSVILLV